MTEQSAQVVRSFWWVVAVAFVVLVAQVIPIMQNRTTAHHAATTAVQAKHAARDARRAARDASRAARDGRQAHSALCALNQRNIDRIATSRQFLREHPEGIPGIPAKLIQDGIKSDQSTVNVLTRTLGDCS